MYPFVFLTISDHDFAEKSTIPATIVDDMFLKDMIGDIRSIVQYEFHQIGRGENLTAMFYRSIIQCCCHGYFLLRFRREREISFRVRMRIVARIPLPFDETIWKVPPNELTREAMPQSIMACGLKPRPSSV